MLPRKAIIAVVVASLLLLGYEGLNSQQTTEKAPNLLLGFAIVGAINAVKTLQEYTRVP